MFLIKAHWHTVFIHDVYLADFIQSISEAYTKLEPGHNWLLLLIRVQLLSTLHLFFNYCLFHSNNNSIIHVDHSNAIIMTFYNFIIIFLNCNISGNNNNNFIMNKPILQVNCAKKLNFDEIIRKKYTTLIWLPVGFLYFAHKEKKSNTHN